MARSPDKWASDRFEGFFTSYLRFLFLGFLNNALPKCQSNSYTPQDWDRLAVAYIDIILILRSRLIKVRKGKQFETFWAYSSNAAEETYIENDMHKLYAHFFKTVSESVLDKPWPEIDFDVYVVCAKKYGSPCHRLTIWVSRSKTFSTRVGDVARAMWESDIEGHNKGRVTEWYNRAFDNVLEVEKPRRNIIFLTVTLEAARWAWSNNSATATAMLEWAVNHASKDLCYSLGDKHDEMIKELDNFRAKLQLLSSTPSTH